MSISDEELIRFWGESLTPISFSILEPFALPSDTIEFLTKVGLPTKTEVVKDTLNLDFVRSVEEIHLVTFDSINYIIIGGIPDVDIKTGIKQDDGTVCNLYPKTGSRSPNTLALSSSIRNYLVFLQLFLTIRPFPWEQTDEEVVKRVKTLMQTIKEIDPYLEIDPDTPSGHDSYWAWVFSEYLEQVDTGEAIE